MTENPYHDVEQFYDVQQIMQEYRITEDLTDFKLFVHEYFSYSNVIACHSVPDFLKHMSGQLNVK